MNFIHKVIYFSLLVFVFSIKITYASSTNLETQDSKKLAENQVDSPLSSPHLKIDRIHVAYINGTINPAAFHYLKRIDEKTKDDLHSLILIELDTPGGLVTTTKDILTLFGRSNRPYIIWVRPEGASATSAGALISAGAHFIFMSEGTNMGAATPIQMGGNIPGKKGENPILPKNKKGEKEENDDPNNSSESSSDLRAKAINDLVALVRSLSDIRDRNGEGFSEMITKASSFTAREALEKNLINGIANTREQVIDQLRSSSITILGQKRQLAISPHVEMKEHPMDPGQKLLNIFAHPSMAYILFLIGAALLYLELQAPGGFIAGSIGAICLVLSAIGLQVLPLNFGALGLIILSFILFILEIFITSFGLLSLAGFASLIFGSLFLYRTEDSYITFSTSLIVASVAAIGSFLAICLYLILKDQKFVGKTKFNSQEQKRGKVIQPLESHTSSEGRYLYQIKVGGEFWRAYSQEEFEVNDSVLVVEGSDASSSSYEKTDNKNNEMILEIKKA